MENRTIKIPKDKVEFARQVVSVLKQRDDGYDILTQALFELLNDNVIAAFEELLGLPKNQIEWKDIQVDLEEKDEEALVLFLYISYDYKQANPFLLRVFSIEGDSTNIEQLHRFIKFGIPFKIIVYPKEVIKSYIIQATETEDIVSVDNLTIIEDNTHSAFDLTQLTPEQQAALMTFNAKGTAH